MGTDLAGVVTAMGADVRRFEVGDAVNEDEATRKPQSLSFEEAASLPLMGWPL